ncbi:retrotransposon protein [Cucumis melo var. makuwa]|uniref:Retrotransposon protein n=1 Tax=Cucumis melo var. makuwa TaxID=1194695 RepID=A0A5D3DG14_CUCMM|nr:retrotransposon protein [Cucumis melo var. makuwa]TYK22544.1 retrotransposon protein [Cucumis melo var. makuwa]
MGASSQIFKHPVKYKEVSSAHLGCTYLLQTVLEQCVALDCPFCRIVGTLEHSSTRNVIERAFGVLNCRWAILHGKSYYPLQVQCRTILACCLLHNLINEEMTYCDDVDNVDEGDSTYATTIATEDIHYIKTTNEWSQWHDELIESMFTDWQLRNA